MAFQDMAARILPPRKGAVLAITTDTSSRAYDISALAMGGFTPSAGAKTPNEVCLTIYAQTGDVFFYFHSATDSALSKTDAVAAGNAAAYGATHSWLIPAGQERTYTINRAVDKFFVVNASAAGVVRLYASSAGR